MHRQLTSRGTPSPADKPKKQPRQARAKLTVAAILQATTYILERDGFAGFTTNKVAAKAGVNIASLYQYFPGKAALVAELMRQHSAASRAASLRVLAASRAEGLEAAVRALVAAGIAAHATSPRMHRAIALEAPRMGLEIGGADVDDEMADAWRAMLGDAAPSATALWVASTTAHALIHRALIERPEALASVALVDELTALLWPYLRR